MQRGKYILRRVDGVAISGSLRGRGRIQSYGWLYEKRCNTLLKFLLCVSVRFMLSGLYNVACFGAAVLNLLLRRPRGGITHSECQRTAWS